MRSVVVRLAGPLRPLAGNRERLMLPATRPTVAGAFEALAVVAPAVRDRVLTEQGELRPHVNVFVGAESIRFTGGLDTPVPDGAEVWILPAVSGGSP